MRLAHPLRKAGGFTLIELMIGLVLLSLMLSVLFSSLRLGARSWDSADRKLAAVAERELAMQLVRRQLSMAIPVMDVVDGEPPRLAFTGERDRMTWVSPLPAYRGGGGVQRMTLDVGETARGDGLVLRYHLFHPDISDTDDESVLLLEGPGTLEIEYYGADPDDPERREWFEHWDHTTLLPELIRLAFRSDSPSVHDVSVTAQPRQAAAAGLNRADFGPHR